MLNYTGSMAYNLSRFLADLLKPLVGKSEYFVKNTASFSKGLKGIKIGQGEIMNSHNVVSLFTNVPIKEALIIIGKRLKADNTFHRCTNLIVDDIMELLDFVLSTTYFSYNGEIYQQIQGTPMGSPVSVIVSTLFMEDHSPTGDETENMEKVHG